MKAVLKFADGREVEIEIGDVDGLTDKPEKSLMGKFNEWTESAKGETRLMFGHETEGGCFVLDPDIQAAIVADCPNLVGAIGVESIGDGNYVPVYDRFTAEGLFDEYVENSLIVDDITVDLGGWRSRQYSIDASEVSYNWVELFKESSQYEDAWVDWVEDRTDEFAILGRSCYSIRVGEQYSLEFQDASHHEWIPLGSFNYVVSE